MPTIHIIVSGKVRGVFYRVTAKEVADKIGITGWVKNTKEGNVEILASGDEAGLEEFTSWCRKGPSRSIVENVDITPAPNEKHESFSVHRG